MAFPLAKILQDQRDLLLFRPFKPAVREHWPAYLAWGLFVTWLTGMGRYWDHPNANWWQYAGLGSVAYVFVLSAFLWLIGAPLRPRNWSFVGVLIFVTLTSLPALLYAIPVEKFMTLEDAQAANVIFLAIVASWRVGLLIVFLVFEIMGGNMQQTQNDTAYFILLLITVLSVILSPIMLIIYCVLVYRAWKTKTS